MAPHFILEELKVDFELILVDRKKNGQKSKDYLSLNPYGRIPTLVDEQSIVCESAAICLYLGENNPKSKLVPNIGDPDRSEFLQWLMYLTNTLQTELMVYDYPEKYITGNNEEIIATQEVKISQIWSLLDKALECKTFLIGEHISVCDFYLFMLAVWADELKRPPLSFKNLAMYLRNLAKREAVINVCQKENLSLKRYE